MVEQTDRLDDVYRALADPTRRRMLAMLRERDARIKDLAEPLPISYSAVAPDGLQEAEAWLAEQSASWTARADALANSLTRRQRR